MTDDARRDEVVAGALEGVAVPDYEPGFWDRLEARLGAEGLDVPSRDDAAAIDGLAPATPLVSVPLAPEDRTEAGQEPPGDLVVVPMATRPRRDRRRGWAVAGAAAAVVLAVVALQLTDPEPSPVQTAAGGPEATLRTPRGGSTTARGETGTEASPGDTTDDHRDPQASTGGATEPDGGTSDTRPSAHGGTGAAGGPVGDGGPATMGSLAAATTPQEAFVSWVAAIDRGDTAAVVALTGPRTARHYDALGSDVAQASREWGEAYGGWADGEDRKMEPLEAGRSGGERVVVLLLERPAPDAADGTARDAVPVVQGERGWLVEPAAFGTDGADRIEVVSPSPSARSEAAAMRRSAAIEVAAAPDGAYTLALDRTTTVTISASKAVDGVIRWDPPDDRMAPGRHVLSVVHVTERTIRTLVTVLDVTA